MTQLPRTCRAIGACAGRLGALLLLATAAGISLADPPGIVDSQSIVRSLTPSSSAPPSSSGQMTRGFEVAARPGSGNAHKVDLDIQFGNNSAQLNESAHAQLAELGKALSSPELVHARFVIAGHTSASGSAAYNLRLSRSRAEAVRAYLLQRFSISPDRLEATGYGSSRPLSQYPPEAVQQRRVEITTLPPQS
jgi:outer membrane protein OmpA-like peptidoglycan-associated protein